MISVRWLGHSSVVIDLDGRRVITDPLLRRHAGLLRRATAPPTPDSYAGVTAVLLSHLHLDHADLPSLRRLPGVPMLGSAPVAQWLRSHGLRGTPAMTDWTPLPGSDRVQVKLVAAVHHSRPLPHRPNDAHGFLLRSDWGTVWFAGDTAEYSALTELAGSVDLALLPIHGWGPRLSGGHLDPEEAARVCATVGAHYVVPIHYGTLHPMGFHLGSLDWMREPADRFAAVLPHLSPKTTLIPLTPMGPPWQP